MSNYKPIIQGIGEEFRFSCPDCGKTFELNDAVAGIDKSIVGYRCYRCGICWTQSELAEDLIIKCGNYPIKWERKAKDE